MSILTRQFVFLKLQEVLLIELYGLHHLLFTEELLIYQLVRLNRKNISHLMHGKKEQLKTLQKCAGICIDWILYV